MLEFEKPVQLTDHIQIASLPTGPPEIDEAVTAAGWGITQGNIAPDKIKGALLKIISRADCERRVEHKRSNQVAKGNLCAISRTNYDGHATCGGDSGGRNETFRFRIPVLSFLSKMFSFISESLRWTHSFHWD